MIGKAKACSGGGTLGNYVMDSEKGYELDRNLLCGESPKEIMDEMKILQDQNLRATNKTFSMVISPDVEDGKKLSNKELRKITRDFMKKIGIDPKEQQFVAFVHTEKEHKHIHIIANRVKENGTLIPDHHIGKRAQYAAHDIALDRGLISAKQMQIDKIQDLESSQKLIIGIKKEILNKHNIVMNSNLQFFEEYQKNMFRLGIDVQPTVNKQGQIQGHRLVDIVSGKSFKASEINRNMGLRNMLEKGMNFTKPTELVKPLELAANIGLKITKTLIKTVLKEATYGIGY